MIYLHGPPASGKLTVAKVILRKIPGRLFDNHTSIDFARALFDFGTPGFWSLVRSARLAALEEASRFQVPLLVHTGCYSHPHDAEAYEEMERVLQRSGGAVLPVFLSCGEEELKARVGNEDRRQRGKVASAEDLGAFLEAWNIVPVPRDNCLKLDSARMTADESATAILKNFGL